MITQEIKAHPASAGKSKKHGATGFPSWDALFTDVARIIGEDAMYPEKMPDENFEVSGTTGFPSWDALLSDLARIIGENAMYPEEMPDENFVVD